MNFAMDLEECYMATKLSGGSTFFLPFNKGNGYGIEAGKGNPLNPNGFNVSYVWEDILQKDIQLVVVGTGDQRFVDYYNAKQKGAGQERIGMAVSDDMINWRRYGDGPVIDDCIPGKTGISGDPMIQRIGDIWVMFYFGYMWKPGVNGGFDTFACSRDLVHWTKWKGEPLVRPSEPYDNVHAHKPWVIKHNGIVYHFYCAEGNKGRGLALATSKQLR